MGKRVCIQTLGCRVNQYESVAIAEALEKRGFAVRRDPDGADYFLLNTCAVTAESQRQSLQLARRLSAKGPTAVLGCASQHRKEAFLALPGVFYVGGCTGKIDVVEQFVLLNGQTDAVADVRSAGYEPMEIDGSNHWFSSCRAYLKIQDGCGGKCSYCLIPALRGPSRSRGADEIVAEAERLVRVGVKEVVLTGIEVSAFPGLPALLARLSGLYGEGLERVRVGSLSPGSLRADFFRAAAGSANFMPHVHLSLQSGSDRVLRAMRRPYTAGEVAERVSALREALPRVQLSADFITGFPTETEAEAAETVRFARELGLFHVHAFPYSERDGTDAARMDGRIPMSVRKRRCAELLAAVDRVRDGIFASFRGKPVRVLVERVRNGTADGHTEEFFKCRFPVGACPPAVGETRTVIAAGQDGSALLGLDLERSAINHVY